MLNKGSDLIQALQILNSGRVVGGGGGDSCSTMGANRQIKQSRHTEDNSSQPVHTSMELQNKVHW